ncbi:MAG: hypothetical protein LUH15_14305 [Tannerellaceae bacterium]|nr:hypothetical protein [Tannerellaceae bacterium]
MMLKVLPFICFIAIISLTSCKIAVNTIPENQYKAVRDSSLLYRVNQITTSGGHPHIPFFCAHIIELQKGDSLFFVLSTCTGTRRLPSETEIKEGDFLSLKLKPVYTKGYLEKIKYDPEYLLAYEETEITEETEYCIVFNDHQLILSWCQLNNLYATDNLKGLNYYPPQLNIVRYNKD